MKRLAIILAFILSAMTSFSQTKDANGHILVSLWKTYYKAEEADRPQDQLKALDAIKTEAAAKQLSWDWYDAAQRSVSVRSSINWKDRAGAQQDFNKAVSESALPVVQYYHFCNSWASDKLSAFVKEHKSELLQSYNPEFHKRDSRVSSSKIFSKALLPLLKNDYEYVMWSLFGAGRDSEIKKYYAGRYPEEAFIAFAEISSYREASTENRTQEYAKRYEGKAVSLMARQRLLGWEFDNLNRSNTGKSADYKKLREKCTAFEKDRSSFTGVEKSIAECCTSVSSLIKTLDGKDIEADIKNDVLTLSLRNIKSLKVFLTKEGAVAWESDITNKENSYYCRDAMEVKIPAIDDGEYELVCKSGDCEHHSMYLRYSLSIAVRPDSEGYRVFVADYITGKPVDNCELVLMDSDGMRLSSAKDFSSADGFAPLPSVLKDKASQKGGYFQVKAWYTDKAGRVLSSRTIGIGNAKPNTYRYGGGTSVKRAVVLTDRSAFNPGETVQFKAICYTGTYEYSLAPEGEKVTVTLTDPENNEIGRTELTTNDFGSVHGSFPLVGGSRGGIYHLSLIQGDNTVNTVDLRVDEFVLPTFELIWDKDNNLYMPGDKVKVSGKVISYSGHSAANAVVRYEVNMVRFADESNELKLGPDGSFSFEFQVDDNNYRWVYPVSVTVTDATGETLKFSTVKRVYASVPLNLVLLNYTPGRYRTTGQVFAGDSHWIVREDTADIRFNTLGLERESLNIKWQVYSEQGNKVLAEGNAKPGELLRLPVKSWPSGMYIIKTNASAIMADGSKNEKTVLSNTFVKASDSDTALNMDVECFFKELGGDDIALQIGATNGPVWAVVEVFGSGNVLLDQQIVRLEGKRGAAGSLKTISYKRRDNWPESLKVNVLWFRNGNEYSYTRSVALPVKSIALPLQFTRFLDKARPGQECSLLIQTESGVECAATLFDKASETIHPNEWNAVNLFRLPEPSVYYAKMCGMNQTEIPRYYVTEERMMSKGGDVPVALAMARNESADRAEAAFDAATGSEPSAEIAVREDFAATMAWEPVLRSGSDGTIELKFKGADRLSTYYVQLFAHAAGMRNATLRREMQITVPVKISLVEPQFLYEGDLYTARVSLASALDEPVSGRLAIRFYDGKDYRNSKVLAVKESAVNVSAGDAIAFTAPFKVPEGVKELGVLANFVPDAEGGAGDAMFVTVPVRIPFQTLTEAHSALLRNPADRDKLIAELRSLFVNVDASAVEPEERSIIDMVRDAVPDKISPKGKDVLSLTEAWYANGLARRLGAAGLEDSELFDIVGKIAACQNQSGGIAWFEGMESSPVITAAVLQRVFAMPDLDCSALNIEAAVKYLDKDYFQVEGRPWWMGGISLAKYLQTRAMYPSVPFEAPSGKVYKQFKKDVKAYLVPGAKRGLNGQILDKARRLRTLQLLAGSTDGANLAKAWGVPIKKSILRSLDADIESLLQYAVEHVSGGYYYPNAVMPWRGLMESELYAHSLLCDLLTSVGARNVDAGNGPSALTIAEGIRLWLMVQKETQQWGTDASYIEALASVLRGTPETLATKVVLLSAVYTKPFEEVKASGNGFKVSCEWLLNDRPVSDGEVLRVGDKLKACYNIWSEENRSFVRLSAPHPASFRPLAQLSGHYGWWLAPLSYGGWSCSPQGYRNVLADKTEYWFDSYPEENTVITEDYFVTQEGAFQTPAIEIESLYAPHYRANGEGRGPVVSK